MEDDSVRGSMARKPQGSDRSIVPAGGCTKYNWPQARLHQVY